jgi:hypothetical protein
MIVLHTKISAKGCEFKRFFKSGGTYLVSGSRFQVTGEKLPATCWRFQVLELRKSPGFVNGKLKIYSSFNLEAHLYTRKDS